MDIRLPLPVTDCADAETAVRRGLAALGGGAVAAIVPLDQAVGDPARTGLVVNGTLILERALMWTLARLGEGDKAVSVKMPGWKLKRLLAPGSPPLPRGRAYLSNERLLSEHVDFSEALAALLRACVTGSSAAPIRRAMIRR